MKRNASPKTPRAQPARCICQGTMPILTELLRRIGPPEPARRHFDAARLELLKGLRALLDARIADVSKPKGEKIEVE
jgi:hypothetical protein